ncbi:SPOR domain-containing protein [Pseudemcibacter sp.]
MRVDLGSRGVLYRVRGGMIESREAADKVCADLKKNNQSCMVVTN